MKWTESEPPARVTKPADKLAGLWDAKARYLWDPSRPTDFYNAQKYRSAILEWTDKQKPTYWVTLSYRHALGSTNKDFIFAHSRIDRFLNRICQKAYGKRQLASGKSRPAVFGFLEHAQTNKHYNLLLAPDERVRRVLRIHGERIWRKVADSSGYDVERIESRKKVMRYCTKEQVTLGHFSSAYYYGHQFD